MKKLFKSVGFWAFLAAFLIAVTLTITGIVHAVEVGRKLGEYTHIQAVVTDKVIVPGTGADHYSTVASVVEFEVDGVTYTIKNRVSSTGNSDKVGENIEIAYNPNDPNDCLFVKSEKRWCALRLVFSAVFLVIVVVFAAVLIATSIKRESRKRGQ
ncbi:MAG: DUF3592 domain-containing protein [Roseburia sp.]|nr:DUF3592 domain-containing protein [Roseburia sp.]